MLQVAGTLRLQLSDFDDRMPTFHLLGISFVEKPDIRFALSLVGGNIDMIPGFSDAITNVIGNALTRVMVWPQSIRVPIAKKQTR